ncbi:MAG: CinA family nicotinamide mononucleotide deamidase-related protein [Thermodesulfobacteriota bacterium]|nr:CinA family nicotinamide mononucleotide deamidase-related protein [Thermodesulfobacteriota bacterium]
MNAEIAAIGNELLLGDIIDTNSSFIAKELANIGVNLHFVSIIGDNAKRIKSALQLAIERSDIIIITGGIGPTQDDITRECVADFFCRKLILENQLAAHIEDIFKRYGREMPKNNLKQAYIPEGSIPIQNPLGTAPGFILEDGKKIVITLPGVPHEMRYLMEHTVIPYLIKKQDISYTIKTRTIKLFGIGESAVDEKIRDLIENSHNPTIGIIANTNLGEIYVRITAKAHSNDEAYKIIKPIEETLQKRLGNNIFGSDLETFEENFGKFLLEKGLSISVVETDFPTSIIHTLKGVHESQKFFTMGITVSNLDTLNAFFKWEGTPIEKEEFVSAKTSELLADGIRQLSGSDVGIAITGKKSEKEDEDHVSFIGFSTKKTLYSHKFVWPYSYRYAENLASRAALREVKSL